MAGTAIDLFDYRDAYPNAPGFRGADTSKAAADAIAKRVPRLQGKILGVLQDQGPLATFELPGHIDATYRALQPRTSELKRKGLIRDSGVRRTDPETGRSAIVWEIKT